jgi:hypothetical protein
MSILTEVYTSVIVALSQTETPAPTPMPGFDGNADLVTPTWVGFLMTFLVAVATLLLILDMTRRVRRTRYREEIGEMLAAEAAAETAPQTAPETSTRAAAEGTDSK